MVTNRDLKDVEAARIAPLLGAVGALPAAALVLADAEPGAPLFMLAIVLCAGAYVFWLCSDSLFLMIDEGEPPDLIDQALRRGIYMSWTTFVYGSASILCTMAGFAAIHSPIRTNLDTVDGFMLAGAVAVAAIAHAAHGIHLRNVTQ